MIRYTETLSVQVRPGLRSLIDRAATSAGSKPTEWVRGTLAEALRAAGFDPTSTETAASTNAQADS